MSDDLADIADALTRIADVADLRPSRDEDAYHERSIWEELAGVVMFELPRIAHALDRLADTDAKTLLERAAAQAAAPSDEYERGRADERGGVAPVHFLAEIRYRAWRCSCGHVAESHLDLVAHVKATR